MSDTTEWQLRDHLIEHSYRLWEHVREVCGEPPDAFLVWELGADRGPIASAHAQEVYQIAWDSVRNLPAIEAAAEKARTVPMGTT